LKSGLGNYKLLWFSLVEGGLLPIESTIEDRVKVPDSAKGIELTKEARAIRHSSKKLTIEEVPEKPHLEDRAVKGELVRKELIMEEGTATQPSEKRHPRRGSQVSGMRQFVTKTKAEAPTERRESSHIEPVVEEKALEMADVAKRRSTMCHCHGAAIGAYRANCVRTRADCARACHA